VLLALVWPGLFAASHALAAEELDQAARQLRAEYAKALERLAVDCDRQGLKEQAARTRGWLSPRDPNKLYLPILARQPGGTALPEGAPAAVVAWDGQFTQLRHEQANALFELARKAVRVQRGGLGYELVMMALRENPDHEQVRRILGYRKLKGQWATLYEVRKQSGGQVFHPKFGWLPQSYVARYERGQRYCGGKWITAEDDARLHAAIESGWDMETEHFRIRTNHSLAAGAELGVKLEELYHLWQQLFIRFYATQAQIVALFDGRARVQQIDLPRHRIVYFRDRDDYNRALRMALPNIGISTGVYRQGTATAYFFAGPDRDDRTIYHEATHQLFQESRPVAPNVGSRGNFWVIEGIAMYMESLRKEGDSYVLGGFDDPRMQAARYRLLDDKEKLYVPLAEFCSYNAERLQSDPRIKALYSEAAGLTNFLVYYHGGCYRDALVNYLITVYAGRDTPDTLSQLTQTPYATLDGEYREFMKSGPTPAGK
jgi:hypothetical protein